MKMAEAGRAMPVSRIFGLVCAVAGDAPAMAAKATEKNKAM